MKRIIVALVIVSALLMAGCASSGGPKEPVSYRLSATSAMLETSGSLVLEGDDVDGYNIGWWETVTDVISWDFEPEYTTDYLVTLNVSCDPQFPGSTVAVMVGGQTLEVAIPDTGDWANYVTLEAGVVSLDAGPQTVVLQATSVANRFVCNLRKVTLTTQ